MELIEVIAKNDYEAGSPQAYFDWDKLSDKDKAWYLKKAEHSLGLIADRFETMELPANFSLDTPTEYIKGREDARQFLINELRGKK